MAEIGQTGLDQASWVGYFCAQRVRIKDLNLGVACLRQQ